MLTRVFTGPGDVPSAAGIGSCAEEHAWERGSSAGSWPRLCWSCSPCSSSPLLLWPLRH